MTSPPPRIAIPEPTSTDAAYNQRGLPQYIRAVEAAGGTAVSIPLSKPKAEQARLLVSCSGILLPGSPADVDPVRYGQQPVDKCGEKDAAREAADDLLFQDAFRLGKAILGICYGMQSLNVWRQGTLIQDLPHDSLEDAPHDRSVAIAPVNHQPGREVQHAHPVIVMPCSLLSRILEGTEGTVEGSETGKRLRFLVNSSHHQAVDQPGKHLRIVATSPIDGVVEALEGAMPPQFVLAVQWHPERSYESSKASRALFAAFVKAARAWRPPPGARKP